MREWILPAAGAFILFALWVFFAKLASNYISPKQIIIFDTLGMILVVVAVVLFGDWQTGLHSTGVMYGLLSGFVGGVGSILFYLALQRGQASVVTPFVALYPIVVIILSIFVLQEVLTIRQGIGVTLGLASLWFLSV